MRKFWLVLLIVGCVVSAASAAAPKYDLILLAPLPGASTCYANGISNYLSVNPNIVHVVGASGSPYRPTLWSSDESKFAPQDLGSFGGTDGVANAVNESGEIVGGSKNSENKTRAFSWIEWDKRLIDLGDLGGGDAVGNSITEVGIVAGESYTAGGGLRACLFNTDGRPPQDISEGYFSQAFGINDEGEAVGREKSARTGNKYHAVMWTTSGWVDLDPTGKDSTAWAISKGKGTSSWVVGDHTWTDPGTGLSYSRGFMWNKYEHKMNPIPTLGGNRSVALSANSKGQVVGYASTSWGDNRAFVYTKGGGIVDLNTLAKIPWNCVLVVAKGINDQGAIVGRAQTYEGDRAFLLRPKNNAAACALSAINLLLFGN